MNVKVYVRNGYCEGSVSADAEDEDHEDYEAAVDEMVAKLAELVSEAADRYAAVPPRPARDRVEDNTGPDA